jgi:phosphoglycerate dehydrogenase-like enzyme
MPAQIAILDDDHMTRLTRYMLAGPDEITEQWVREFFLPDDVDPKRIYGMGDGLHPQDGVGLIPAKHDARAGSDAAVVIFRRGTADAALIAAHPKLKLIQRIGERPDGIDLDAAAARGIRVSCLPRPTLQYTAEHTILLMLALAKRLIEADAAVRAARFDRDRLRPENGVAYNWVALSGLGGLHGKTIGIIGLGEVGALVAGMARSFGAKVIYTNRTQLARDAEQRLGVDYVPLPQLLGEADFVSMHASNLPENKSLIDAAIFAQMKPTAYFINTSRGRMVDEDALHAALTKGVIAGAGLDVHTEEPRSTPDRLATLRNVILTPHIAGGPRAAVLDEIAVALDNCRAALAGKPIKYQVAAKAR